MMSGVDYHWSQSELNSRTAKEIESGNFDRDFYDRYVGGGIAYFWKNQKYEVKFVPVNL